MTKKLLALLLALTMGVCLFAGCTSSAPSASDASSTSNAPAETSNASAAPEATESGEAAPTGKTPITMWFWGANDVQREAFQVALVDVYNASQSEYELVIDKYANTVDNDIPVALAAGVGPDVVYTSGPSFCNVYVKQNKLLDLTPYSEQYGWRERLLPAYYDTCMLDGKLYSLPNSVSIGLCLYNKALFTEKGWSPPKTIEEMEALMQAATDAGLYAGAGGNRGWRPSNDNFSSVMLNHFVSPTNLYKCLSNEQPFNNPEMVAGVEKMYDWYQKGAIAGNDYTALDSMEAVQLVSDKRAAFIMCPTLYLQFAATTFANNIDELGYFPMPNSYAPDKTVYDLTMPCTFAINANSKHPDAAAAVLDIMMSADFSKTMTERWPGYWGVPLRDGSAVDTSNMTGLSLLFMDIIKSATPDIEAGNFGYHPSAFFPPVTQDEFRNVEEVWNGTMSATDYLNAVDAAFQKELAEGMVVPPPQPAV